MLSHHMSKPCETLPRFSDFHDTLLVPANFHFHCNSNTKNSFPFWDDAFLSWILLLIFCVTIFHNEFSPSILLLKNHKDVPWDRRNRCCFVNSYSMKISLWLCRNFIKLAVTAHSRSLKEPKKSVENCFSGYTWANRILKIYLWRFQENPRFYKL